MEVVGIGCAAAAAVESREAVSALFFCVDITELELIPDIGPGDAGVYIAHQELFLTYELVARIKISPRGNCQVLSA